LYLKLVQEDRTVLVVFVQNLINDIKALTMGEGGRLNLTLGDGEYDDAIDGMLDELNDLGGEQKKPHEKQLTNSIESMEI
jgi:hypothetical protein